MSDDKKLELALPGEWALKKAFGPTLDELGDDLRKLYAVGRDKILTKAFNKLGDTETQQTANLRVARDVLWNGAFSTEEICAEYFGGIFASSCSADGTDDSSIHYVDVIKSLSSRQLKLHYVIYNTLNRLLVERGRPVNVAQSSELEGLKLWYSMLELERLGLNIDTDLNILFREGLISQYASDQHVIGDKALPYANAVPSTFGVLLYAVAHNKTKNWRQFSQELFGDFPDISLPSFYTLGLEQLLEKIGLGRPEDGNDKASQPQENSAVASTVS